MMRISTRQALMLFFLTCASVVATSSPSRQQRIAKYEQHAVTSQQNEYATTKGASFLPVVYVSIFNSAVNMLRPDPAIIWQARVPRALWEICIALVAKLAHDSSNPSVCLLLSLMLVPTALVDIFVWSPSFAMFANFETCTGGGMISRQPKVCTSDYVKGIGRMFASVQSLFTGVIYLLTAVMSWTVFAESRDSSIARKNAEAMADTMAHVNRRGNAQLLMVPISSPLRKYHPCSLDWTTYMAN